MTAYLTLGAACFLFSFQFIFSKWYQLRTKSIFVSAVWMNIFSAIWYIAIFFSNNGFSLHISFISGIYAIFYTLILIVSSVVGFFAMKYGSLSVLSLFLLTGGLIIPVIYGVCFLNEKLTLQKGIGVIFILLSFLPYTLSKKESTYKNHRKARNIIPIQLLYFIAFLCNGMISVITKAQSINVHASTNKDFLASTALLRLILGIILIVLLNIHKTNPRETIFTFYNKTEKNSLKEVLYLFFIVGGFAVCNGIANLFSMVTAKTMDSSFQFPLLSAAVIVITALISWAIYKEKPSAKDTIGIFITLTGIAIMIL